MAWPPRLTLRNSIAIAVLGVCGLVLSPPAEAATPYRWKSRPLYVFAAAGGGALAEQRKIVADNRGAMRERDMVVIWVIGETVTAELGAAPGSRAGALRRRFGVEPGVFRVILVGKDGGEKLTQAMPIAASRLFATIDAMPMRRDEVRRRGG